MLCLAALKDLHRNCLLLTPVTTGNTIQLQARGVSLYQETLENYITDRKAGF